MAYKTITQYQTANNLGNLKAGDIMVATRSGSTGGGVVPSDVLDSNGNIIIELTATASAVNHMSVQNTTGSNSPEIGVIGTPTNLGMTLRTKGTGRFNIASADPTPLSFFSGTALQHLTSFTFADTAANRVVTFPDSTGTVMFDASTLNTVYIGNGTPGGGTWTAMTGSGSVVRATSPTLVTPLLGTPTSGTLTNCTGYRVANVANLGTGVATFLTTPSSANLRSALTDETGTGSAVFATSPTLVTPILGTPTSGSLTNCSGYAVGNIAGLGAFIATFLSTPSSANLINAITDETGSGSLVFGTSPAITAPVITGFTNGSSAAAGIQGEVLSSILTSASLTSGVTANVTSLALTAGDWQIWGVVYTNPAAGTTTSTFTAQINPATATIAPSNSLDTAGYFALPYAVAATTRVGGALAPAVVRVSGTTTYYLNVNVGFAVSTMTATCVLLARRVR